MTRRSHLCVLRAPECDREIFRVFFFYLVFILRGEKRCVWGGGEGVGSDHAACNVLGVVYVAIIIYSIDNE